MNIKQYMLEQYELTELQDIAKHGCSGGVGGFIYYNETCAFHDEHEAEIWDMLEEDREDSGEINILDLIGSFNGAKNVGSMTQLKNMLCWYAVERTANEIINEIESDDLLIGKCYCGKVMLHTQDETAPQYCSESCKEEYKNA